MDYPACLWLSSYLQRFDRTVLIVSHDRNFLNEVCTDIIHFTNKKTLDYYRGDYSSFVKVREEKYKADKRAYEAQQMRISHIEEYINTYYTEKKSAAQNNKIGQVLSKQKILDKMERIPDPDEENRDRFSLSFPTPYALRVPHVCEATSQAC